MSFGFLIFALVLRFRSKRIPFVLEDSEKIYYDPKKEMTCHFGSVFDEASLDVSVVVPAFNEEKRIKPMLDEALGYLDKRKDLSWEVIVVDDGSKDGTSNLVLNQYVRPLGVERVRVLTLPKNRGKGGAVRRGFMQSRGKMVLMADADGATKFSDYSKLESALVSMMEHTGGEGIAVGSRAHKQEEAVATRSFFRNVLMWGFHFVVDMVGIKGIRDTQCGFKLFARSSVQKIFPKQHIERWAFDVELLWIAQCMKIPIKEV